MREKPYLGELEKLLMLAILGLNNDADGTSIRKRMLEFANRDVSVGATYATLDRMEQKGFIRSELGAATSRTGNRQMKFYSVEAAGSAVLKETEEVRERMMVGVRLAGLAPSRGVKQCH